MARGTLRLYLGAAPGVGKTFAMLGEGRRRHERGTDVVVAYVETHGRPRTAEQLDGLEVVPRRRLDYRGQVFEEMDVDAVIARRPELALVDELAHTNVPGSRNPKRWHDVEALLAAGINVISTVNVQHLESLNDVVERITGITQQETVPDAFVRTADQIELVDQTPEALRRRMAHGNIYRPEKVDAALANYFRPGNLAALRELALLWVADRVDEALQDYRERHGIAAPWETKERVVVALTGAPGGEELIRRAARMAMRTKAELYGITVRADDGLASTPAPGLVRQRALLEELGGSYHEAVGPDVAKALVQVARAENATQLVLGASRRSRWNELVRGSVVNRVIREAGGALDVHIISTASEDPSADHHTSHHWMRPASVSRRRLKAAFILGLVGFPLLTVVLTSAGAHVDLSSALGCYLLLVIAISAIGGAWPGAVAAVVGFALSNWFFAPPVHTFTIANARDLIALVVFLVAGGVVSTLVDQATRRSLDASRAKAEARSLTRMAGVLVTAPDPLPALLDDLVVTFGLDGAAVLRQLDGEWVTEASAGISPPSVPADGAVTLPLSGHARLALSGRSLPAEDREVLSAYAAQLAVALEARRLQAEAANATALAKANELRTALLAAVSHDLRTPLASIKAATTTLLSDDVAWDEESTRALLETMDEETDRLDNLVGNLLDMSRLQTDSVELIRTKVGLDEVVASALMGLATRSRRVEVDVPETLPRVDVDPALLERAVANLVENALAFTPDGQQVRIVGSTTADRVELRVVDRGPGIPPEGRERVLRPFQRLGDSPNRAGVGLGLAVANGFVRAMGGELIIDDTPGGGCTMIIVFPSAAPVTADAQPVLR